MSPIIATTFCPGASPLPAGAASTVPAASMPGTRGKLTPAPRPSRSFSSERLRPNASTRIRTQPSRSGGSGSVVSRRLPTGPGPESWMARMVAMGLPFFVSLSPIILGNAEDPAGREARGLISLGELDEAVADHGDAWARFSLVIPGFPFAEQRVPVLAPDKITTPQNLTENRVDVLRIGGGESAQRQRRDRILTQIGTQQVRVFLAGRASRIGEQIPEHAVVRIEVEAVNLIKDDADGVEAVQTIQLDDGHFHVRPGL